MSGIVSATPRSITHDLLCHLNLPGAGGAWLAQLVEELLIGGATFDVKAVRSSPTLGVEIP